MNPLDRTIRWLFVLCLNFHIASGLHADDWPQFRGPERDGRAHSTSTLKEWKSRQPPLLMTLEGAGSGYSSLCIVGNVLYTTGNSDSSQFIAAFDLTKRRLIKKTDIVSVRPNHAELGARSTPTYSNGKLYVISSDGKLVALDAKSLDIEWSRQFQTEWNGRLMSGWGFSESVLVDRERIIVTPGGTEAMMVAVDRKGKELWRCNPQLMLDKRGLDKKTGYQGRFRGAGYSSAMTAEIGGIRQYVQFTGDGLIGVRATDGKLLWWDDTCNAKTANICNPLIKSNRVVYSVPGQSRIGLKMFSLTAKKEGFAKDPGYNLAFSCHHGGMVENDGFVYLASGKNRGFPLCFELDSGKVKWGGRFRGPGTGSASVVYCDGNLIFRYQDGTVALIKADPERFRLLGKFQQAVPSSNKSWSHPVVVNAQLFLREQDRIMVYDLSTK